MAPRKAKVHRRKIRRSMEEDLEYTMPQMSKEWRARHLHAKSATRRTARVEGSQGIMVMPPIPSRQVTRTQGYSPSAHEGLGRKSLRSNKATLESHRESKSSKLAGWVHPRIEDAPDGPRQSNRSQGYHMDFASNCGGHKEMEKHISGVWRRDEQGRGVLTRISSIKGGCRTTAEPQENAAEILGWTAGRVTRRATEWTVLHLGGTCRGRDNDREDQPQKRDLRQTDATEEDELKTPSNLDHAGHTNPY